MDTFIWFQAEDKTRPGEGDFERQIRVNNPAFIPRVGEFVDMDLFGGWVSSVQYMYSSARPQLAIYVILSENK